MQDKEGSKAIAVYIIVCFLLAGAAGVGYKLKMTERDELSDNYGRLYTYNQKVGLELSPNIQDYWNKVASGTLKPVTAEIKEATPETIKNIAKKHNLDNTGKFPSGPTPRYDRNFTEYKIEYELKGLMLGQWEALITDIEIEVSKYACITDLRIERADSRYDRIGEMPGAGSDTSLWNVTFTLRWFAGPKQTATPRPA